MFREPLLSGELSPSEKVLLARGAGLDATQPQLHLLVSLAADSDQEVRQAAEETLRRLPDAECAKWLAAPALEEAVARYFLEPEHLRPALLPILLTHPASPADAVAALAAKAGPELVPVLLAHLEVLKNPVLVALKANPAYLDWQAKSVATSAAVPKEEEPHSARQTRAVLEESRLGHLISLAASPDESVSGAAQETLQNLSDEECLESLASISVEEAVARYFLDPAHLRPALLPILLTHPDTPQDAITSLAASAGPDGISILLDQLDTLKTPALIALKDNPTYLHWQKNPPPQGLVLEVDLLEMLIQEMETEQVPAEDQEPEAVITGVTGEEKKRGMVRKIARMNVAQRVKLALLGSREERGLLIRDSSRVVCRSVLSSPKLNEAEVESFATMKNVSQDVLRLISINRKFMKNYTVVRNLVNNPRLPIDVGLPLLNRLLPSDLRAIAASKDVPDTTRKMAQKRQRDRTQ